MLNKATAAFGDHIVALTPVQQVAVEVIAFILQSGTSLGSQGILFIVRPSAREVLSYIAVAFTLYSVHHHLRSIIELRDASGGQ